MTLISYLGARTRRAVPTACLALTLVPLLAGAQSNPTSPSPFVEELRQKERERALREQQERSTDARLQVEPTAETRRLPANETPCFRIDRLALAGELSEHFQGIFSAAAGPGGDDSPIGRCLGTEAVNIVLSRLQQAAIAQGYVTTRVLASSQDLSLGLLTLTLVPGRVAAIRLTEGSNAHARVVQAIPIRPGDLLNLRDIEQGLENLKRVPTAEADIQIEPSNAPNARPGDSDLLIKYSQSRQLRGSLSADDSGTQSTGRYQGGITLSLDNPLSLNDLLYFNANHSLDTHRFLSNRGRGNQSQSLGYSVPWGYWQLGLNASASRYHQTVAGYSQDYVYAGRSNSAELSLGRGIYRDQFRKSNLNLKVWRRESRNFVDDAEIGVQHRTVAGWTLELNHKEYLGAATLEGKLAWRQGFGAFGARRAPEEFFDEGTSRMRVLSSDVSLNAPFELNGQKLRYTAQWRAQWDQTRLLPQDQFAIGGRYTVRGFDGETSLAAERGWLVRNDIGWAIPDGGGAELYLGLDYGHVGGSNVVNLLGNHLAGGVLGLRGSWGRLSYDLFAGAPISKPEGYRTARVAAGFNLTLSF